MGTRRHQRISDAEICARYAAGEAREAIGRRAGLWNKELLAVLSRNGVILRSPEEIKRLIGRKRHTGTLRLKPAEAA